MLEVALAVELGSPAARVWDVTGDFARLAAWHPWVESSVLEPAVGGVGRRVVNVGGTAGRRELVERLVYLDTEGREYAYEIVGGTPAPFTHYVGRVRVVARGDDRCTLEYHARFAAAPGATDDEARERVRTFYASGLANLARLFGA